MKKIVFLSLYPKGIVPGPRFRYEQYLDFLAETNQVKLYSFFSAKEYQRIRSGSFHWSFIWIFLKGYSLSFLRLFFLLNADYVFIYRDVTPLGPPVIEWIMAKLMRKKIIYDFDDAVWLSDVNAQNKFKVWLRNPQKTDKIISWSYKVSVGNDYLLNHAKIYNENATRNPTTIDTEGLHNELKNQYTTDVVIGWTGTHSTLIYLEPLIPLLAKLEKELSFTFLVICNKNPHFPLQSFHYLEWNKESEKEDLLRMNFGVMPLSDDEWSKGKCGFKALQYMALGMPALVSPVGVNAEIVSHGNNGFICSTPEEWETHIRQLILNVDLRHTLGIEARKTVEQHYSVLSNKNNFLSLFR